MRLSTLPAIVLALGLLALTASATAILPSSSTAYVGFGPQYAIDPGSNRFWTDYASNGLGSATHLDFDFGTPLTFTQILYTDRTSSGGMNDSQHMGTYDFVTEFTYIFATDSSFNNVVDTIDVTHALPTCSGPCTTADLADFQVATSVPDVTAQYMRWQVVTSNGVNPGAADFSFTAVPEPGSLGLMALGIVALVARKRL